MAHFSRVVESSDLCNKGKAFDISVPDSISDSSMLLCREFGKLNNRLTFLACLAYEHSTNKGSLMEGLINKTHSFLIYFSVQLANELPYTWVWVDTRAIQMGPKIIFVGAKASGNTSCRERHRPCALRLIAHRRDVWSYWR